MTTTSEPLATVEQLAARLGETLTPETPDYVRAEAAIEDVSERARSIAGQPTWSAGTAPAAVRAVVIAAARRIYTNPDRYLSNMAGTFQATVASDQFTGDIFMLGELAELAKFRPTPGVYTQRFGRDLDDDGPGHGYAVHTADGTPMPLAKPILLAHWDE